jgi:hypothetical protein
MQFHDKVTVALAGSLYFDSVFQLTFLSFILQRVSILDYIAWNDRATDELERIWKEATVSQSGYSTTLIYPEGLSETTKNLPGQPISQPRFEQRTFRIDSRALPVTPARSITEVAILPADSIMVLFTSFRYALTL